MVVADSDDADPCLPKLLRRLGFNQLGCKVHRKASVGFVCKAEVILCLMQGVRDAVDLQFQR